MSAAATPELPTGFPAELSDEDRSNAFYALLYGVQEMQTQKAQPHLRLVGQRQAPDFAALFSPLAARCQRAGFALTRCADDDGTEVFLASRWGKSIELRSVQEVESFLRRIGGAGA